MTSADAWPHRVRHPFGDVDVIDRDDVIRNKRFTGRPRELGDIEGIA